MSRAATVNTSRGANERKSRWRPEPLFLLVLAITVLGAWLRLATASDFAYWGDEFWTLLWCRKPVAEILRGYQSGLTMHLYILFQKLWTGLFGFSPLVVRLPSLVAGIVTIPVLFWVGRRWLEAHVAAMAALLYAVSAFVIRYDRMARVYPLLTLAVVLSMWWFLRALKHGRDLDWLLLGAINAGLLALSLNAVYVLLVQAVAFGLELATGRVSRRRALEPAAGFCVAVLLVLAFYSQAFHNIRWTMGAVSGATIFRPELLLEPLKAQHFPTPLPWLLCLAAGGWATWRRGGAAGRLLVLWALLPPLVYFLQRSKLSVADIARYLVPTLPAQFLLIAAGLTLALHAVLRSKRWSLAAATMIVLAMGLGQGPAQGLIFKEMEPTNLARARILDSAAAGDVVTCHPYRFSTLLALEPSLRVLDLKALSANPSLQAPGRLIVLTEPLPEAKDWWSQQFTVEVLGSPRHRLQLYVLTSEVQPAGADGLRAPLQHFLLGFVTAADRGAKLYPTAFRHFWALGEIHVWLSQLASIGGDGASSLRHRQLSGEYQGLARSAGETVR